jgi:two-component system copper resistance phosphate regulon response regulator CusR
MRVLLVEDEEKVARFLTKGLKEEQFSVDVASDGAAALEQVRSRRYDLIVLDIILPGALSGTEVLRLIRDRDSSVPIMMLTARDAVGDKITHLGAGADDYLTKPFELAELAMRLRVLLRRAQATVEDVVRVADLTLNRKTHEVAREGIAIRLTAKEFSLLEYLMANVDRVVSRNMIVEHVWDQSFEGLTNIVDVYIRKLRAKVDDPSEKKLIQTVPCVGYCLSERPR